MSSLQNLAALTIFKKAARNQIKTIVKAPELVGALGPNRTEQLQTLRRLLKFLDLYVEHKKALILLKNAQKLPPGVSLFKMSKANRNARQKRMAEANQKVHNIDLKARKLRNKIGLHLYRNILPFNNSTLRNAVRRISLLRNEGNNGRKLRNNLQAVYNRRN
jgi:hypothetical protein